MGASFCVIDCFYNRKEYTMEIKVPTRINDIPLKEYQRFAKANVEGADPEFLMHKTIEIFCEMDLRDVARLPLKTAEDLFEEITAVMNQDATFTRKFTLDGIEYGFIPDLEKMSLGEYIDLEEGLKDPAQFHKAAAVMYRPITKQFRDLYAIEPYTADSASHEVMKDAPLGEVTAAVVFFYSIVNELQVASLRYSRELVAENTTTLERGSLPLSTDGLTAFMHYLKEIQQSTEE